MSKHGVFSGRYFTVFGLNTGKYGPEQTPYLDTFHAVLACRKYKNYYNDQINLHINKFDYEILKTVNKITKIPRTVNK